MMSLWKQQVQIPRQKILQSDFHVQNVVIGGGMTGLLTAYFLQKKGQQVIVLEAQELASGQTGNTTAKITSQHGFLYQNMVRRAGKDRACGYAMANEDAINFYEELIWEEGIACHFERIPSYLYTTDQTKVKRLEKEADTARKLGIRAHLVRGNKLEELPFAIAGAVCFRQQAQFHPLEFMRALAKKLTIYEHTKVLSVKEHAIEYESKEEISQDKEDSVQEHKGTITADHIIFATHYPFVNIPGFYFLRQHQKRSYVLALEGEDIPQRLSGQYYSMDKDGLSFRSADGLLLMGGGSHRTGKHSCPNAEQKAEGYTYLRQMAQRYYPHSTEVFCWSAQDCMPHDRIPFIGRYSVFRPYWYVATGFQKWGMTSAMVAASVLSDQICGIHNMYEAVFTPQRFLVCAGIQNLCIDIGESTKGLIQGMLTKSTKRCSHMGCKLVWNKEEQSWDCPCHGSRFSADGSLLDTPAQKDVEAILPPFKESHKE